MLAIISLIPEEGNLIMNWKAIDCVFQMKFFLCVFVGRSFFPGVINTIFKEVGLFIFHHF